MRLYLFPDPWHVMQAVLELPDVLWSCMDGGNWSVLMKVRVWISRLRL
jgi:hypothetical protein